MADKDITDEVRFELNDGESMPLIECVCGEKSEPWDFILGMDRDYPHECPNCKRKLYFKANIRVYEKGE